MADKKISDTLFEALDIIINKRIEAVQKDKTILCVVEDAANAKNGEYVVSNAAAKFTAYSENTNYVQGQNVWVLIPEGDYNNEKKIIGKYAGDPSTPYVWVDPMDSFADMSGDILGDNCKDEIGLIANCSAPINIFTGRSVGTDREAGPGHTATSKINTGSSDIVFAPLSGLEIYDRIGISADFRTDLAWMDTTKGSYGLVFIIKTEKKIIDGDSETTVNMQIPLVFDSADMWGNPYNYGTAFTQSLCFDINPEENGTPVGITGYFYQNYDFKNASNEEIAYYSAIGSDYELLDPNIFVSNIQVSFGYAADKVVDDTVYIFTPNSKTYIVNDNPQPKTIQARIIYVADDGTRYAINNIDKLNQYKTEDTAFGALNPSLHWYRYVREEGVSDEIAGDFWQELENFANNFSITVNNKNAETDELKQMFGDFENERFKCILWYNPEHEGEEAKA